MISILCDGKSDTHQFFPSIEERENFINKKCDNFDECKKYQAYEQKN